MMRSIRVTCSTLIYRDLDIFRALDLVAAAGFGLVDMCIVPNFCPHFDLKGYSTLDVERLREYLNGLRLSIVSLNVMPGYLNALKAENVTVLLKRSVDLAAQLKAQIVTLPSGFRVPPDEWEHSVQKINQRLSVLIGYAESRGISLSIEAPHLGTLTETVGEAVRFFDIIDPRVKCTFDTSHVFVGEKISLLEGLNQIGVERINQIHLRDAIGEDISFTPGKGNADFRSFFDRLLNSYSGDLCIELEFQDLTEAQRGKELRFAKRYLESLIHKSRLPMSLTIQSSRIFQLLNRFFLDPKKELKRHRRIISIIRKVRPHLIPLIPIRIYDGYWRNKWYLFGRSNLVALQRGSTPLFSEPSKKIRVCIQGCGYAGTMHAFAFQRIPSVKVVGACDVNPNKAGELAHRLKCSSYQDLNKMIKSEKPDLVAVCTPEWEHYNSVMQLLEAGIDVFCEKILATRYNDAEKMVRFSREKGRVLGVNYNYRFMPGIRKIWEIIQRRSMGELHLLGINVNGLSYHHALDLVTYLGGRISYAYAQFKVDNGFRSFTSTDWSKYDQDILYGPSKSLVASFGLINGAAAVVSSSCLYPAVGFILSIDAIFEKGIVSLTGINMQDIVGRLTMDRRIKSININYKQDVFSKGYEYCFYQSTKAFLESYVKKEPTPTSGEHGLYIMDIERAISASNKTGSRIRLT
jgi:predicted dehydrogenase/sugar phosphate isomerase/epimerase